MTMTRRHLPHWQPNARAIFLTWHLFGSISPEMLNHGSRGKTRTDREKFATMENVLHAAKWGPQWLAEDAVAECVRDCLLKGDAELNHYRLYAYTIMNNHVHALVLPLIPLAKLMKGLKGASARYANLALQRTGQPFWAAESFDHWCRTEEECVRIVNYIENNPVKARIVSKPEDWKWSSAYDRHRKLGNPA